MDLTLSICLFVQNPRLGISAGDWTIGKHTVENIGQLQLKILARSSTDFPKFQRFEKVQLNDFKS